MALSTKPETNGKNIRKKQVAPIKVTFTNSCNCFSFDLIILDYILKLESKLFLRDMITYSG